MTIFYGTDWVQFDNYIKPEGVIQTYSSMAELEKTLKEPNSDLETDTNVLKVDIGKFEQYWLEMSRSDFEAKTDKDFAPFKKADMITEPSRDMENPDQEDLLWIRPSIPVYVATVVSRSSVIAEAMKGNPFQNESPIDF